MGEPARVLVGRYALLRELGRGAMGVVWLARDELLRREVAVKQLLVPGDTAAGEAAARAMREARIAARLHHPNAISVFDVVTENGQPWLVMEYLPSRTLAQVLADGPLPPAAAAGIGARVAAALAAAHELGIVHRDVKPGNVLLGDRGDVKITDFGIARASDDVTVTRTGMMAGTPAYLAPEVARGAMFGPASDVFSLGATLYAAVEGRPPFGLDENNLAVLHRVAAGQYLPPRLAGPMSGVLGRLLALDPQARPAAAAAAGLLGEVERVASASTAAMPLPASTAAMPPPTRLDLRPPPQYDSTPPPGDWPPQAEPNRRSRWRWPVAAVALVVVVVAVIAAIAVALNLGNQPGAASGPSGSTTRFTPTSQEPPATTTSDAPTTATSTTTTEPQPRFDKEDVAEFVKDHYDLLPNDTETAWNNLTTRFRPEYEEYVNFWSGFEKVEVEGKPVVSGDGRTFSVEIKLSLKPTDADDPTVERQELRVVAENGRLLIDGSTLLDG